MIQLLPDLAACARWFNDQNVVRGSEDDLGYAWHAIFTAAFGDKSLDVFSVVQKPGRALRILGYSQSDADELQAAARTFAEPGVYKALGLGELASKPMPDTFSQRQRFGFEVRTRPTSRLREGARVIEKDVFIRAILAEPERQDLDRNAIYLDWFTKRVASSGINLEMCNIQALKRTRVSRRDRSGGGSKLKPVEGPDVTFSGVLTVVDPQRFGDTLAKGIGRHKSFGFGMLLLSPPK